MRVHCARSPWPPVAGSLGWLMLLVPLAHAAELDRRDVFVSGQEGYHTYRIPALVALPSGSLLAICEGRKTSRADHGDVDLVLKRSTDGGQTWGPVELIYEEGGTARITIGNPCPVFDPATGTLWLPFTKDNDRVLVTSSRDEGRTWAPPRDITAQVKQPDWTWYATGPGNGIVLTRPPHAGRLVIPCDHRVGGDPKDTGGWNERGRSHVIYSDDHGQTWRLGGSTDYAMNECAVVELADGTLMLNSRSYRGKACRGVSLSRDGGQTWQPTRDDLTLVESVCQASLIRAAWPTGDRPGLLVFANPAVPRGRTRLTVRLSEDDGRTWPYARLIEEGSSAYSSLALLPDGAVGLLYERDNFGRLTFTRFSPSWIREAVDGR